MKDATVGIAQQLFIGRIEDILAALPPCLDDARLGPDSKLPEKRRQSLIAGRSLLKFALVKNKVLDDGDPLPAIFYTKLNKPYFNDLPLHFNLSHSHGWMVLALGSQPQGVDLEAIDPKRRLSERLVKRVLSVAEYSFFQRLESAASSQVHLSHDHYDNHPQAKSPAPVAWDQSSAQPLTQVQTLSSAEVALHVQSPAQASKQLPALADALDFTLVRAQAMVQTQELSQAQENIPSYSQAQTNAQPQTNAAAQATGASAKLATSPSLSPVDAGKGDLSHVERAGMEGNQSALNNAGAEVNTNVSSVYTTVLTQKCGEVTPVKAMVSLVGREFFFLQWTLKECLLKLQGASIFDLDSLAIDPQLYKVVVPWQVQFNPWFSRTLSFKLSNPEDESAFWLTVGVYDDGGVKMWRLTPQPQPALVRAQFQSQSSITIPNKGASSIHTQTHAPSQAQVQDLGQVSAASLATDARSYATMHQEAGLAQTCASNQALDTAQVLCHGKLYMKNGGVQASKPFHALGDAWALKTPKTARGDDKCAAVEAEKLQNLAQNLDQIVGIESVNEEILEPLSPPVISGILAKSTVLESENPNFIWKLMRQDAAVSYELATQA